MTAQALRPTLIRIFLTESVPEGIRFVEKSNWADRAAVASRTDLSEALQREELGRPGVYVLVGPDDAGATRIYIGEADVLCDRIKQHASAKDFWTRFVAFSRSDGNLNKSHVRNLEARLISLAKQANQWEVDNTAASGEPPPSESDQADVDWFLNQMLLIYPILRADAFEVTADEAEGRDAADDPLLQEHDADGRGREVKDGFVVVEGSLARATETNSIHAYLDELCGQLMDCGVIVPQGELLLLRQDYRFSSPSTAAGVLVGGAANGRRAWNTSDGRPPKQIQNARVDHTT